MDADLVKEYMPLVKIIAGRIKNSLPPHVELDDLISGGSIGLMVAINGYDKKKWHNLKPYAEKVIKGAIIDDYRSMFVRGEKRKTKIEYVFFESEDDLESIVNNQVRESDELIRMQYNHALDAISRLGFAQRIVLSLLFVEGLSPGQVASLFNVTETRIFKIRSAALVRVRKMLECDDKCRNLKPTIMK